MQAVAVAPRGLQRLFAAVALTLALFATAIGVAAAWPSGSHVPQQTIRLTDVPHGVSETVISGYTVILVRTGDDVVALSPEGYKADQVVWCPNTERFVGERWWSEYAPDGTKLGGPGEALSRYEVIPRWDAVIVRVVGDSRVHESERHDRPDGHPSACPRG